jgi:outer membrane immunogenic protein
LLLLELSRSAQSLVEQGLCRTGWYSTAVRVFNVAEMTSTTGPIHDPPKQLVARNPAVVVPTLQRTTEIWSKLLLKFRYLLFWSFAMVRKFLLASAALALISTNSGFAADLPVKAPPVPVPPPVYDWTGLYVGGNFGWGWAHVDGTQLAPGTTNFPTGTIFTRENSNGFLGGVQAGFNYQTPYHLVVGVEGDFDWTDIRGSATTISTVTGFTSTNNGRLRDFALLTGRVGWAADNWLFYAKGGVALGQSSSSSVGVLANGTLFETGSSTTDRTGWTIGAGVEWGFAPGWSAKIEYNHIDFVSSNIGINHIETVGTFFTTFVSSTERVDVVKGGINYRFNWGAPVVANY